MEVVMLKQEIMKLFDLSLDELIEEANRLRIKYFSNHFDLCSINNVKNGKCTEDCSYCAQSIHFKTEIKSYNLIHSDSILNTARSLEDQGVHKHSLVSSGGYLQEEDLNHLKTAYRELSQTNLDLCASHGILNAQQAVKLKDMGIKRYHHNLETSKDYYPKICTTHLYQERIDTIKYCKSAGLEICSGGIWGLGESREDRIDMLLTLLQLDVDSVPINILCPIEGTPLEKNQALDPFEIMKTLCIYRIVLKDKELRLAGGRIKLDNYLATVYKCGVNGILTGDYLTTTGYTVKKDQEFLESIGYTYKKI